MIIFIQELLYQRKIGNNANINSRGQLDQLRPIHERKSSTGLKNDVQKTR